MKTDKTELSIAVQFFGHVINQNLETVCSKIRNKTYQFGFRFV